MLDDEADDEAEPSHYLGISGTELVASYNWLDEDRPKIIIPGKPPLWTPPETPSPLQQDAGVYYRDRNAACYPEHPMEPAVVSVMKMRHAPCPVDVFACGSTLGNLLRFSWGSRQSFRMLLEMVGGTVHLIRREESPRALIPDVRGYGYSFPEAYTTWEPEVRNSLSHQRIIRYAFGELYLMVRFEADGYIGSGRAPPLSCGDTDVLEHFEQWHVGERPRAQASASWGVLSAADAGAAVPQDCIFELKTRSVKKQGDEDTLGKQMPRLWVSQVPTFILAFHERGLFTDVRVTDAREKVRDWEAANQAALGRFLGLLKRIIGTAQSHRGDELEIVRQEGGSLEIRKRAPGAGGLFSGPVRGRWAAWLGEDGEDGEEEAAA
ncbi:hypothetical protein UVI_02049710 [Ustilaginoidea virens]|nr:hypothetical protein UVI_02049710 [Ustilaginoidea virens]